MLAECLRSHHPEIFLDRNKPAPLFLKRRVKFDELDLIFARADELPLQVESLFEGGYDVVAFVPALNGHFKPARLHYLRTGHDAEGDQEDAAGGTYSS